MILAGIDEAGYGPRLGPLCVAAAAFRLPEERNARAGSEMGDLRLLLSPPVGISRHALVPVSDSKELFEPKRGLGVLWRGVVPFARLATGLALSDARQLLEVLLGDGEDQQALLARPWYAVSAPAPPPGVDGTAELAQALRKTGISCLLLSVRALDARSFNRLLSQLESKALLSFTLVTDLMHEVLELAEPDGERVLFFCDRQAGRRYYAEVLQRAFPDHFCWISREHPRHAVYFLQGRPADFEVHFRVGAEAEHLAVALASMSAKLVRELLMARLNTFFAQFLPGLSPTAGYPNDAERFLRDTAEFRREFPIADEDFVREK